MPSRPAPVTRVKRQDAVDDDGEVRHAADATGTGPALGVAAAERADHGEGGEVDAAGLEAGAA